MQAAKMFEWVTGGYVLAGFHEVVYTEDTRNVLSTRMEEQSDCIAWRVSSTVFCHLDKKIQLKPNPSIKNLHVEKALET